ncbi:MAG: four helix bundle protein [Planctomycetes bacterium]|nr:four helix bundle protein [Planctomycetota bacterium]
MKQIDRARTSIPLNIAEGNGRRSPADRSHYLQIARGSALECAASLDVLVARRRLREDMIVTAKSQWVRIVEMLTKMSLTLAPAR